MTKLNCSEGDLAITVNCSLSENIGNIVYVRRFLGPVEWHGFENALPSWDVEIATPEGWLAYDFDGYLETAKAGPVPDAYLRRLTPPRADSLRDEGVLKERQLELFI